jgi:hypothetical protein
MFTLRMHALPERPAPSAPSNLPDGWEMLGNAGPVRRSAGDTGEVVQEAAGGVQEDVREMMESVSSGRELRWPDRHELLGYCREVDAILAAILLFFGVIYSAFGYTLFRLAVTLNVAGLGVWAGFFAGKSFDARLPGMVIGGVLFAALAWPAMRLAVAVCGGLVGFVIGVAVWRSLGMADNYAAAGGLIGAIFLFMLSFSLFKLSILAFTAIQGAVMILAGVLGLLLKHPRTDEQITNWTTQQPALLPIVLLALSLIALIFQQQWHRQVAAEPAAK